MIEFQKKIVPYLDGSLSKDDRAEFEAFVSTHPEFETQIKAKQDEIQLLKSLIPSTLPSNESRESIEAEMRASIFNLLKEEPKDAWGTMKQKWEEWTNRY